MADPSDRLVSDDVPARWATLPYSALELHVHIPYTDEASIDAIRIWMDGKQLQPGELMESSRQVLLRGGLMVQQITYRWDCPPLGRHLAQASYLRAGRWSPFGQPVRFEIQPPPTPQIIAIAQGDQQPRPIVGPTAVKIHDRVTLKLSGVKPNDRVAVELQGGQFIETMVSQNCCVTVDVGKLAPAGRYSITVRNLTQSGCGLSSKASSPVWIDFFDARAMITTKDLIGDRPLKFRLDPMLEIPSLVATPSAVADLPHFPIDDENCEQPAARKPVSRTPASQNPSVESDVRNGTQIGDDSAEVRHLAVTWSDDDSVDDSESNGISPDTFDASGDPFSVGGSDSAEKTTGSGQQAKASETSRGSGTTVDDLIVVQEDATQAVAIAKQAKAKAAQTQVAHQSAHDEAAGLTRKADALTKRAVELQTRAIRAAEVRSTAAAAAAAKAGLADELEKQLGILRQEASGANQAASEAQKLWLSKIASSSPSSEASVAYQVAANLAKEKSQSVENAIQNVAAARSAAAEAAATSAEASRQADKAAAYAAEAKQEALVAVRVAGRARQHAAELGVASAGAASYAESTSELADETAQREQDAEEEVKNAKNKILGVDPVGARKRTLVDTESTVDFVKKINFLIESIDDASERVGAENESLMDRLIEIDGATGEVLTRMLEQEQLAKEICEQHLLIQHYRAGAILNDREKSHIDRQNKLLNERIKLILDSNKSLREETRDKLISLFVDFGILSEKPDENGTVGDLGDWRMVPGNQWNEEGVRGSGLLKFEDTNKLDADESADTKLEEAAQEMAKLLEQLGRQDLGYSIATQYMMTQSKIKDRREMRRSAIGLIYRPEVDEVLKDPLFQDVLKASQILSAQIRESEGALDHDLRVLKLLVESSRLELETLGAIKNSNKDSQLRYPDARAVARQKVVTDVAEALVEQRQKEHATEKSDNSKEALEQAKAFHASATSDYQALLASHALIQEIAKYQEAVDQAKAGFVEAENRAKSHPTKANLDAMGDARAVLDVRRRVLAESESKLPAISVMANIQASRIAGVRDRLSQIYSQLEFEHAKLRSGFEVLSQQRIVIDRIAASVDDLRIADSDKIAFYRETLNRAREETKQWRSLNSVEGARLYQELARVKDVTSEHQHRMSVAKQISDVNLQNDIALKHSAEELAKDYWARVQSRQKAADALLANAPPTKTYFHSPAHFPIPRFGTRGLDDAREGMTIAEGMELVTKADGSWTLEYRVQRAMIPVKLSMQIQFRTHEEGPWHTITLRPRSILPGREQIDTVSFSELTLADFEEFQYVTVTQQGKHPALDEHGGRVVEVRRSGNARYGRGYRGLNMYQPVAQYR